MSISGYELWSTTSLETLEIQGGQHYHDPFYRDELDGKTRLYYRVSPLFVAWVEGCLSNLSSLIESGRVGRESMKDCNDGRSKLASVFAPYVCAVYGEDTMRETRELHRTTPVRLPVPYDVEGHPDVVGKQTVAARRLPHGTLTVPGAGDARGSEDTIGEAKLPAVDKAEERQTSPLDETATVGPTVGAASRGAGTVRHLLF